MIFPSINRRLLQSIPSAPAAMCRCGCLKFGPNRKKSNIFTNAKCAKTKCLSREATLVALRLSNLSAGERDPRSWQTRHLTRWEFDGPARPRSSDPALTVLEAYVRFGSKADICTATAHVCFTHESGHSSA